MQIKIIGIDLAKNIFQLHGVDHQGHSILQKRLTRGKLQSSWQTFLPVW
jgi:transposase